MLKVKFLILFGIMALLPHLLGAIVRRDPAYTNQRRVGFLNFEGSQFYDQILAAFNSKNDFFDNFFNVNGKPHDRGADYMLTDDIYQKPNPFYTKQINDNVKTGLRDHLFPVYTPKHNESHQDNSVQDAAGSQSIDTYEQPPTAYDDRTHSYNTNYNTYSPNPPPSSYGAYGSPAPMPTQSSNSVYGPPSPSYAYPTAPHYPYPNPSYGPAASPSPSYYPTAAQSHEIDQKSHEGFFLKLIKKFDLVLMSKILLKLIIFKKIIKFIAVMCLLLFLPALKKKFSALSGSYQENDDEDRKYKVLDSYSHVDFRIKEIANFALTAIEGFETHQIPWCVGESELYCRVQYMLDQVDFRYPGYRMLSLWFPALTTTAEPPVTESSTAKLAHDESMEVHFNDYITDDASERMSSSIENANGKEEEH